MAILVTGGAGYIGSHTCVELLNEGYELVVVDNLSNGKREALRRVEQITGKTFAFYEIDLLNRPALDRVFKEHKIEATIHCAGLKAVGESVEQPLTYYRNNVAGTIALCEAMQAHGVYHIVFSSSATVYGSPAKMPVQEHFPLRATNPYGRTKWMIEQLLRDLCAADKRWSVALLRYFNPIGAHPSGKIGEDPRGRPNNLMPFITQVAIGKLSELQVFGNDYDTKDGTGVRDYIHVVDLAIGHVKALRKILGSTGAEAYNLGTGKGYSVLELIAAFERASGRKIPYRIGPRRPGDIAVCFADPRKAQRELGWRAERGIEEMCADAWRWQSQNPNGYESEE